MYALEETFSTVNSDEYLKTFEKLDKECGVLKGNNNVTSKPSFALHQ